MYWDIWFFFGFLNICDFLRVPWAQMKSENLRNSKIVLHFLTGASKLELLASKHNQRFLGHMYFVNHFCIHWSLEETTIK